MRERYISRLITFLIGFHDDQRNNMSRDFELNLRIFLFEMRMSSRYKKFSSILFWIMVFEDVGSAGDYRYENEMKK